jgi:hypothetical protein
LTTPRGVGDPLPPSTTRRIARRALVDLLDGTHHERAIRAGAAKERHILPGSGDHVRASNELAALLGHVELEGARDEGDDVPLGGVELTTQRVDAQDAAPQAGGAWHAVRPARLASTERSRRERAGNGPQQHRAEEEGEAALVSACHEASISRLGGAATSATS